MVNVADKLVEPVKILIVVGMAYTLATAGWYFVGGPAPASSDGEATTSSAPTESGLSIDEIAAFELFGIAAANAPVEVAPVFDAPQTRLNLMLEGVWQADDPKLSTAIVSEPGRESETYAIGDTLPGNAVLAEVLADRIVLRRGATMETLRFPETVASLLPAEPMPESELPPEYTPEPEETPPDETVEAGETSKLPAETSSASRAIEDYKKRLETDPKGTLDSLGIAPVSNGAAEGYRLGSHAQSPYFAQTGLQPGDIILSVNGQPVGDVQQDQRQIDNVLAQGSARLEVQRGQRRFFVTASLK